MSLVRKIKINKITPVEFTKCEDELIDILYIKLRNLKYLTHINWNGYHFYLNDREQLVLYHTGSNYYYFTFHVTHTVNLFSSKMNNLNDIKDLLVYIIKGNKNIVNCTKDNIIFEFLGNGNTLIDNLERDLIKISNSIKLYNKEI